VGVETEVIRRNYAGLSGRNAINQCNNVLGTTALDSLPVGDGLGHELLSTLVRFLGGAAQRDELFEEGVLHIRILSNLFPSPGRREFMSGQNEYLHFLPRRLSQEVSSTCLQFARKNFLNPIDTLFAAGSSIAVNN